MKLRCLIIDDEPLAHKVIIEYAKDVSFLEIKGQEYLATDAIGILQIGQIDLLFLDINMPKLSGLDFLRTLKNPPIVIITSAYDQYALETYELDVCDYLLKPFRFGRFLKATSKAYEIYKNKSSNQVLNSKTTPLAQSNNQLFIKSDKRLIQVDLDDVFYLESYGNYVKVWLESKFHLTFKTLSSFENQLPLNSFFRIHKSFIINKKHIRYIEGNTLVMKNSKDLPIGKNNKSKLKQFLTL